MNSVSRNHQIFLNNRTGHLRTKRLSHGKTIIVFLRSKSGLSRNESKGQLYGMLTSRARYPFKYCGLALQYNHYKSTRVCLRKYNMQDPARGPRSLAAQWLQLRYWYLMARAHI